MSITYRRSGGRRPPPDRESLQINDDSTFTLWRSIGAATYPASPIGRFSGALERSIGEGLARECLSAVQAGDLSLLPKPDGSVETILVDSVRASLGANDDPTGPWQPLIAHLRQLLGDLTAQPQAAISAQVQHNGTSAQLVHLGDSPLLLDLTALTVRAVLWQNRTVRGDWRAPQPGVAGVITAAPGWSMVLPFDHGFAVPEGASVRAYVTFTIMNGDQAVPVSLEAW